MVIIREDTHPQSGRTKSPAPVAWRHVALTGNSEKIGAEGGGGSGHFFILGQWHRSLAVVYQRATKVKKMNRLNQESDSRGIATFSQTMELGYTRRLLCYKRSSGIDLECHQLTTAIFCWNKVGNIKRGNMCRYNCRGRPLCHWSDAILATSLSVQRNQWVTSWVSWQCLDVICLGFLTKCFVFPIIKDWSNGKPNKKVDQTPCKKH